MRDVGRVLDVPYADVDVVAKMIPMSPGKLTTIKGAIDLNPELRARYESDDVIKDLLDTAMQLEGMPRNASTHAAGVVLDNDCAGLCLRDGALAHLKRLVAHKIRCFHGKIPLVFSK